MESLTIKSAPRESFYNLLVQYMKMSKIHVSMYPIHKSSGAREIIESAVEKSRGKRIAGNSEAMLQMLLGLVL